MTPHRAIPAALVVFVLASSLAAQGFEDVTTNAGLGGDYIPNPFEGTTLAEMAGAVAVFDYDGDGWDDIFWHAGSAFPARLFRNDQDGTFTEVGAAAGIDVIAPITSAAFGDIDNDHDLDLFLTTYQDYSYEGGPTEYRNFMFLNNGDGTFSDITLECGLKQSGRWGAAFGDLDKDQDLDLVTVTWNMVSDVTHFYRNNNDGTFTDVTPAFILNDAVNGFAPTIIDYDGDGDQDVLSANDFESSRVWRNDGDWQFTDVSVASGITPEVGCCDMGSTFADLEGDGDPDWFITDVYATENIPTGWVDNKDGNRLWVNNGDGTFTNEALARGVHDGGWGWGAQFGDMDNDADVDIVHVNGFYLFQWQPDLDYLVLDHPRVYLQESGGNFSEASQILGVDEIAQGRGCVLFDYDHDGLLDVLISNNDTGLTLYRNKKLQKRRFVQIGLDGRYANEYGVGAKITVSSPDLPTQTRWMTNGCNFVSQAPPTVWFGVKDVPRVRVDIKWPSGWTQTKMVNTGRRLVIEEPEIAIKKPY